jgi:dihydrofolate reductase
MIGDTPETISELAKLGLPPSHVDHGRFSEFRPHQSLALTHMMDFVPGVAPYEFTMRVEFFPSGEHVRMVVTLDPAHSEEWTRLSREAFESQLGRLDKRFGQYKVGRSQSTGYWDAYAKRPLRYSINVTLDGCCDHLAMIADEDLHRHAVENIERADALLLGRVTYQMMEEAWRSPARTGVRLDWMADWGLPFARTIDAAKKYVVSSTLDRVDWNAEIVRGDLGKTVQQLKRESGKGLFVGGVKLPLALAELGLIDEYEFVVHPRLAGHGPTLFAGLSKHVDLKLVSRLEFGSGAVAMRYEPRR